MNKYVFQSISSKILFSTQQKSAESFFNLPTKILNNILPSSLQKKNALRKHLNMVMHGISSMLFQHLEMYNAILCQLKLLIISLIYNSISSYNLVTKYKSIFVNYKITLVAMKRFKIDLPIYIVKANSNALICFNIEKASFRIFCF